MRDNVFWLEYGYNKDLRDDDSRVKSHRNQWEIDMTSALVRYMFSKVSTRAPITPFDTIH